MQASLAGLSHEGHVSAESHELCGFLFFIGLPEKSVARHLNDPEEEQMASFLYGSLQWQIF